MRLRLNYLLLSIFILASCGKEKPKKPKNLISKDKMVLILQDIALINAAKSVDKKKIENKNVFPVAFIYKKHNIDSLQFAESNAYYAQDVVDYKKLYTQVEKNLKKIKAEFKLEQKEKQKQDSIIKAQKSGKVKLKKLVKPG